MNDQPPPSFPATRNEERKSLKDHLKEAPDHSISEEVIGKMRGQAKRGLDKIVRGVQEKMLEETVRDLEEQLNEEIARNPAPFICNLCGRPLQDKGMKPKEVITLLGTLTLRRRYGYCHACKKGSFPDDEVLGLDESGLSPEVKHLTGLVGGEMDFASGSTLLWEASRIRLSAKQVERMTESLGEEISKEERECVEPDHHPLPVERTIYIGMDGTGVPMQSRETAGRKGKQADGSSKTREAKTVDIWEANTVDKDGIPVRDPGSVSYSASIESAACGDTNTELSAFAHRVEREGVRRGVEKAARVVVIGDGAAWIWNIAEELFPGAIHIVDRFHAKQHLSNLSKVVFGATPKGEEWTRKRYEELDSGRMDNLIKEVGIYAFRFPEAKQCRTYFQNNRERMRYPEFRAQGLGTSSGVVEAGCKSVVGGRLKKSGMHWSVRGANAILALRCSIKSGRYPSFWDRRERRLVA